MNAHPHEVDDVDHMHLGDAAVTMITRIINRAKDAADEALDARRTHNGMTLEQFLVSE